MSIYNTCIRKKESFTTFVYDKIDTVTDKITIVALLSGYKEIQPFVYAGFFPVSNEDYNDLKEAIERLSLSDSVTGGEPPLLACRRAVQGGAEIGRASCRERV